jgi:anti-sigma B factor antagonist
MDLLSQGRKVLPNRFPKSCLASLHGIYLSDFSPWHKMTPAKGLSTRHDRRYLASMQIEKSSENGVTTLKVSGEVDLHASPELRSELQSCVSEKTPVLLVDFTAVEYIDSSGLATFIEYLRDAAAYDGKIALFGMKQEVRTIFDLVRLNELFTIADSADAAVAALASK